MNIFSLLCSKAMKNTNCTQKWQLMLWCKTDKRKISAPVWLCACSVQVLCLFYSCCSVFHKGGVWIRPSSIAVTTSELPSVTHTWGVEGKCSTGFGLNGAYMCSLDQQVSGFTINPFFNTFIHAHKFTFTYLSFKSVYYEDHFTG